MKKKKKGAQAAPMDMSDDLLGDPDAETPTMEPTPEQAEGVDRLTKVAAWTRHDPVIDARQGITCVSSMWSNGTRGPTWLYVRDSDADGVAASGASDHTADGDATPDAFKALSALYGDADDVEPAFCVYDLGVVLIYPDPASEPMETPTKKFTPSIDPAGLPEHGKIHGMRIQLRDAEKCWQFTYSSERPPKLFSWGCPNRPSNCGDDRDDAKEAGIKWCWQQFGT